MVHQVDRQAALEQRRSPLLDRNILKGDGAAKRLRILPPVRPAAPVTRGGFVMFFSPITVRNE
jgi:hypothetical protein